ncbi:MAG: hypothetical protein WCP55_10500 [Lentisphaerota bacterium]
MGSKAQVIASIAMNFPPAEHFYDLFGGGFSVTHFMLQKKSNRYTHFHYNEINADIVDLVTRSINGDFNYNKFLPPWVSREDFFAKKDHDAYIRCLWSFGNSQSGYLFSDDIESYKKSMHMAVVFNEFDNVANAVFGFLAWPKNIDSIFKKRIYLRQKIEHYRVTNSIPKILYPYIKQLERLEQLERLQQLEQLEQLQQLERLQRLQQLQQLQQLERLHTTACDYRNVDIQPNSVVYCDIPYKDTKSYLNDFDHKTFLDWAASRPFPVFISEYNISDPRFKLIYSIDKRPLFNQTTKICKMKSEKLYWYGK